MPPVKDAARMAKVDWNGLSHYCQHQQHGQPVQEASYLARDHDHSGHHHPRDLELQQAPQQQQPLGPPEVQAPQAPTEQLLGHVIQQLDGQE